MEDVDPFNSSDTDTDPDSAVLNDDALLTKVRRVFKNIPTFFKGKGVLHAVDPERFPHHTLPLQNPLFCTEVGVTPSLSVASFMHFIIVTFWFPQSWYSWHFNAFPLCCIRCGKSDEVGSEGCSGIRKVAAGHGEVHGLCTQKLKCARCQVSFSVLHPNVVEQYPDFVKLDLGLTLTRKGAIQHTFLNALNRECLAKTAFNEMAEKESELAHTSHAQREAIYYSANNSAKVVAPLQREKKIQELSKGGKKDKQKAEELRGTRLIEKNIEHFPKFEGGVFKGWSPSRGYLQELFCTFVESVYTTLIRFLSLTDGDYLSLDHTFRITKYIWQDGQRCGYACLSLLNEYCQIVKRVFVRTTSYDEVQEPALQALFSEVPDRYKKNGWNTPKHCCIDFANFKATAKLLKEKFGFESVSGDDWHAMDIYVRSFVTNHLFIQTFCSELSNAMYLPDNGDKQAILAKVRVVLFTLFLLCSPFLSSLFIIFLSFLLLFLLYRCPKKKRKR